MQRQGHTLTNTVWQWLTKLTLFIPVNVYISQAWRSNVDVFLVWRDGRWQLCVHAATLPTVRHRLCRHSHGQAGGVARKRHKSPLEYCRTDWFTQNCASLVEITVGYSCVGPCDIKICQQEWGRRGGANDELTFLQIMAQQFHRAQDILNSPSTQISLQPFYWISTPSWKDNWVIAVVAWCVGGSSELLRLWAHWDGSSYIRTRKQNNCKEKKKKTKHRWGNNSTLWERKGLLFFFFSHRHLWLLTTAAHSSWISRAQSAERKPTFEAKRFSAQTVGCRQESNTCLNDSKSIFEPLYTAVIWVR